LGIEPGLRKPGFFLLPDSNSGAARVATRLSPHPYYGLLTSPTRANNIARIRELLAVPLIPIVKAANANPEEPKAPEHACPCCGSRMRIIETFLPGQQPNALRSPQHRPAPLRRAIRIDTS
jgi:hypothetical protein